MLRRRYCSSFGGRPCPASRGSSSICAQCTSPRAQFVQIVRIVRAQTHFYYAFRYGDQDGYSPLWRSVALRCSGQSADAHPHSPPFYCPQCVTSLLVSSTFSPPPLCPLRPRWTRPNFPTVLSTAHAEDPFLCSTTNPTQGGANPYSGSDDNPNNERLEFLPLLS